MDYSAAEKLALECGFSYTKPLDVPTIEFNPQVREMCQSGKCARYGKCWSCPPACGTLEECAARVRQFSEGILVQTVGELEDELDGEGMMETQALHKQHLRDLVEKIHETGEKMFPLGAGTCDICKTCAYPDAPCRFPEKMISSMESYGMLVMQVCKANGMEYYHGKNTIAYTSCVLLK